MQNYRERTSLSLSEMKKMFLSPEQVVENLVAAFRERKGVFRQRINIEDWVPEDLDKGQKAMFLFLTSVLDYGMRSTILYRGAQKLFAERPELLQPKILADFEESKGRLATLLLAYLHVRFPNEAATRWSLNCRLLLERFEGEVLKIFQEKFALKVLDSIYLFRGFGRKTGHLFFRGMVNTFGLEYPDIDQVPMPIDRHKLRLTYEWGFISQDDYRKQNRKKAAEVWKEACRRAGISWLEFDRAFWIWGSSQVAKRPKAKINCETKN